MKTETGAVIDGIEIFLFEKVGQAGKALLVERWLPMLRSPKGVHHKEAIRIEGLTARLEVTEKGGTFMEAEIAEIESADDVGFAGVTNEHISL